MSKPRRSSKRRGSALIFVSVMLISITSIIVANAQLNLASSKKANRVVSDARAQATFDAEIALVSSAAKSNSLTLPLSQSFTLNGYTLNVDIRDNSSIMDRTVLVNAGGNLDDKTYTFQRIIGGRQTTYPLYFAVFADTLLNGRTYNLTTTNRGHVYCKSDIPITPTCSIEGDVISAQSVVDTGATTVGNEISYGPSIAAPNFNHNDYKGAGNTLLNLLGLTTVSFTSVLLGQPYPISYCEGNTDISGIFLGKGTLFIHGNATISGDITPLLGAKILVIVDGTLTINLGVNNIAGWWYVKSDILASGGATLHVNGGSLCTGAKLRLARPLDVAMDRSLWDNRNEAIRFHAPGFWPTLDPNLTR